MRLEPPLKETVVLKEFGDGERRGENFLMSVKKKNKKKTVCNDREPSVLRMRVCTLQCHWRCEWPKMAKVVVILLFY